jgi:putative oxidoreductase
MKLIWNLLMSGPGGATLRADVGLAVLRVVAGCSMAYAHGLGKVQNPAGIIGATESLGFPAPVFFGWAAALAEFIGGILLALGLMTRLAAFMILNTMCVAAFIAHRNDPFQKKELAILYAAIAVLFIFVGSGRLGLDPFIRTRLNRPSVD